MSKMKTYKLSELYEMSSGISSKKEQAGHGSPFASFSTVFNNTYLPDVLPDLMDTSEKEKETYSIKAGDIFLTRTSETLDELGMSSVAVKDYPNASYSGFLKRLRPTQKNITYAKFMAFYLRSYLFRKTMNNNATMTLRASLNEQIFSYLDIVLPEYNEQIKIGDLFHKISQKIAINNKINQELEAMAKTLYDYWFVQFDFPDKNGKPYKSSEGKMIFNEELKREIPVGWEVKELASKADFKNGKGMKKELLSDIGKTPVFGSNGIVGKTEKSLFNNTVIAIGRVGANYGEIHYSIDPCWITDNAVTSQPKSEIYLWWLLLTLKTINYSNISGGSAQPLITQGKLKALQFPIPNSFLLDEFHKIANPNYIKINNILKQNQKLSELRDWLLPMLMNGQVSVGE